MAVDFHTHILPGVDDGSASTEMSLRMLQEMEHQGIKTVVATPHFYANYSTPTRFLEKRKAAVEGLAKAWKGPVELRIGAEVHYFDGISDCEALKDLTIAGTHYVLVEMPGTHWSDRMYLELENIYQKQGLTPIIAHVDRYISPWKTSGIPERLERLPVLVQANADFFIRRSTRAMALRMLRRGQIHLLGSDCHNLSSRTPNLGEAVEIITRKLGAGAMQMVERREQRVLQGE